LEIQQGRIQGVDQLPLKMPTYQIIKSGIVQLIFFLPLAKLFFNGLQIQLAQGKLPGFKI